MALVTCPDCKTEVSDQAATCPKCARPVGAPAKKDSPFIFPGLVAAVVGAGLYFGGIGGAYGMMIGMLGMLAGFVMTVVGIVSRPK
jgi:hypothetical protein